MKAQIKLRMVLTAMALVLGVAAAPHDLVAQEIDFSHVGSFESMGTGTVHGGGAPKTLVDDDRGHAVFLTIWDSNTDTKVDWKPIDGGAAQTTVIHGTGVRAFQTNGLFKIEAVGQGSDRVKYDYVLLGLRKE
jgi:hypothetical protein